MTQAALLDGTTDEVEEIELELLLDGVHRSTGVDYRDYARTTLVRRVRASMKEEGAPTISSLQEKVLRDRAAMSRLLSQLSVPVTSMFRDPSFFAAFRAKVVPYLRSYPFVRIWHAGCASGEEVYSTAILLHEEGLFDRCRIYATDISAEQVEIANRGIYPLDRMQEYSSNYLRAGGTSSLADYYTAQYDHAIFRASLRRNIVFAQHNLANDGVFNEFHVVFCRNVLIYFNAKLQEHVHRLFLGSMRRFGVLALGRGETVRHSAVEELYEPIDERERIFRRRG